MVFEEEDFQPMQYGYRLSPDIFEQKIIGMLKEVEEDLHKKSKLKNPEVKSIEVLPFFFLIIQYVLIFLFLVRGNSWVVRQNKIYKSLLSMLMWFITTL